MARPASDGGSRSKKPSAGQQRILRQIEKSNARKQLTTLKGIGGIVGNAILEGVGGPKARAAGAAVKTSAKVARAIAKESAGKGAKAPFGIYRKPSARKAPRLRDTDNTPRKTTVRQQVGPKTQSGKFSEAKRKPKTSTQPPASKTTTKSTKVDLPKRIPTRAEVEANRRGAMYKGKLVKLSPGQIKSMKKGRGSEDTIESRLARGEEKLDVTSRNASRPSGLGPAEWRKYAQVQREIRATEKGTGVPVSKETIAKGRARALQPTAERRAAVIRATQQRAVAKAKARGMSDAQIKQIIAKARAEAAAIAKKAK